MTAADLMAEAKARGLRLEPRGDRLAVTPANLCPADFATLLRLHKSELLALLALPEVNERHVIRPGDPIPAALLPVLQSWQALRKHPAWQNVVWPSALSEMCQGAGGG